jgi:hypothetical protein
MDVWLHGTVDGPDLMVGPAESPHESIRATLAAYTWAGDHGDADTFADCFAETGVLYIKSVSRYEGRDVIKRAMMRGFELTETQRQALGEAGRFSHHVTSVRIELLDADHAQAWSYFSVFGRHGPDHWGRYSDELHRVAGKWLFTLRRVSVDGGRPDSPLWLASRTK